MKKLNFFKKSVKSRIKAVAPEIKANNKGIVNKVKLKNWHKQIKKIIVPVFDKVMGLSQSLGPIYDWDYKVFQNLQDELGFIDNIIAFVLTFLSPIISWTDLGVNIYYILTQDFQYEQIRVLFLFFMVLSLVVQILVWTHRHHNFIVLRTNC